MMSPSRLALMRRIQGLREVAKRHRCSASHTAGTILREWCTIDYCFLRNPSLPYSRSLATEPKVVAFVKILRQLTFLEATYWLSSVYAMLADASYRKKVAMFFTPASLTKGLLDDLGRQGVDFRTKSFIDPACGGAAFLAPIALRIRTALLAEGMTPRRVLKHIEARIYGADVDKTLCELSKHYLCMALHEEISKSGYIPSFKIHRADSLTALTSKQGKFDVVVCNPPYRKMTAKEIQPLRAMYADVVEAQPNLYCLFIALCVRLLHVGGYAALVTPTSFLSGRNFGRLRKFLMRQTKIEHIGIVSDRLGVFIDVQQETALTVLRRRAPKVERRVRAHVSVVSGVGRYASVGSCVLPNGGSAWPIPRSVGDVVLLKSATRSKFRLSDYGYAVRIGAYVWNRDKSPKYDSIQKARRAKAHTVMPLLWSRDISVNGTVRLGCADLADKTPRFIDLGRRSHSAVVKSRCVVMQRVTSNDQPRRLVAAVVSPTVFATYGGFVGENHVVIVEQKSDNPVLRPSILAKLLSAHVVDRCFKCISGATNVSVFELEQLALPDPQALKAALASGYSMDEAAMRSLGLPLEY